MKKVIVQIIDEEKGTNHTVVVPMYEPEPSRTRYYAPRWLRNIERQCSREIRHRRF